MHHSHNASFQTLLLDSKIRCKTIKSQKLKEFFSPQQLDAFNQLPTF